MGDAECLLGPFAKGFRESNDLTQPMARQRLLLMAKLVRFEISGVEALHATARRLVLSRIQTHRMDLPRLSSEWTLQRLRTQARHEATIVLPAETSHADCKAKAGDPQAPTDRKRKGAGEPWRAHCSENKGPGVFDFKALGRSYAQLPEQEKERLRAKGKEATMAKRHCGRNESPFGLTQKEVERFRKKQEQLGQLSDLRRPDGGEQMDLFQVASDLAKDVDSTAACVSASRAAQRQLNRMEAEEEKSNAQALAAFHEKAKVVADVVWSAHPEARETLGDSMMAPSSCTFWQELRWPIRSAASSVVAAAELAAPHQVPVRAALDADLAAKCDMLRHDLMPPSPVVQPASREFPCWTAGVCLCGGAGAALKRRRNRLVRFLAQTFRRGHPRRLDLQNGSFLVRLLFIAQGDPPNEQAAHSQIFWHISYMMFSPYLPIYQGMELLHTDGGVLTFQASMRWQPDYQAVSMLDASMAIHAELFELVESWEPVGRLNPRIVRAQPFLQDGQQPRAMISDAPPAPRRRDANPFRHFLVKPADDKPAIVDDTGEPEREGDGNGGGPDDGGDLSDASDGEEDVLAEALAGIMDDLEAGPDGEGEGEGQESNDDEGPAMPQPPEQLEAAPQPAPPAEARARRQVPVRERADASATTMEGKLFYYDRTSRFFTVCSAHEACTRTRTSNPSERKKAQGRPLGYMAAWLLAPAATKEEHIRIVPSHEDRAQARRLLRALAPGFEELESYERPQEQDEESEPEGLA